MQLDLELASVCGDSPGSWLQLKYNKVRSYATLDHSCTPDKLIGPQLPGLLTKPASATTEGCASGLFLSTKRHDCECDCNSGFD